MVSHFPPCLPTATHPLQTTLHRGCLFLVGCCVSRCRSAAVQRQRCISFFIFCRLICHPQTIIRHPPHTFRRNCVSSMMIPSSLTPTFGWLSRLTSERRPQGRDPIPLSNFLWVAFWCPKQEIQPWRSQTRHRALAVDPWGVVAPRFGGATALPMEREGEAAGG